MGVDAVSIIRSFGTALRGFVEVKVEVEVDAIPKSRASRCKSLAPQTSMLTRGSENEELPAEMRKAKKVL